MRTESVGLTKIAYPHKNIEFSDKTWNMTKLYKATLES